MMGTDTLFPEGDLQQTRNTHTMNAANQTQRLYKHRLTTGKSYYHGKPYHQTGKPYHQTEESYDQTRSVRTKMAVTSYTQRQPACDSHN